MSVRSAADWCRILISCLVRPTTAARWAYTFANEATTSTFSAGEADLVAFLGQVLHESGKLERVEENLSYSAERLCVVWPKRFPTPESAQPFARNGPALANHVYGGRLGNTAPDDGWRYRGRGLIQVTGKDNYRAVGKALGVDLVNNPGLLAEQEWALRGAIRWWEGAIPDSAVGDIKRVTRLVNGGETGLGDRLALTDAARRALS